MRKIPDNFGYTSNPYLRKHKSNSLKEMVQHFEEVNCNEKNYENSRYIVGTGSYRVYRGSNRIPK